MPFPGHAPIENRMGSSSAPLVATYWGMFRAVNENERWVAVQSHRPRYVAVSDALVAVHRAGHACIREAASARDCGAATLALDDGREHEPIGRRPLLCHGGAAVPAAELLTSEPRHANA
jgi:hypothetical protein